MFVSLVILSSTCSSFRHLKAKSKQEQAENDQDDATRKAKTTHKMRALDA